MSYGADCDSTRAVVAEPSGRRTVTLVLELTTWTFVRIVSAATKNPDPRPDAASMVTTAGEPRLTRSSSPADGGPSGDEGGAASSAIGAGGAAVGAGGGAGDA